MNILKKCMLVGCLVSMPMIAFSGQGQEGGESTSYRTGKIVSWFAKNGQPIKAELIKIVWAIEKADVKGGAADDIRDMIEAGLIGDIQNSPYQLRDHCEDEKGNVRSASTTQGEKESPICINVPKLARENTQKLSILATLAHEHARHLGYNDVGEFNIHPIAAFIEKFAELFLQMGQHPVYDLKSEPFLLTYYADVERKILHVISTADKSEAELDIKVKSLRDCNFVYFHNEGSFKMGESLLLRYEDIHPTNPRDGVLEWKRLYKFPSCQVSYKVIQGNSVIQIEEGTPYFIYYNLPYDYTR